MNSRHFISFVTALAILVSLITPSVARAHRCAGTEAVARSIERNALHHDDDCAGEECHHDGNDNAVSESSFRCCDGHWANEMMFCCCDGVSAAQHTIDNALLPTRLVVTHAITILHGIVPSIFTAMNAPLAGRFKADASPPYLASKEHSTYLRISVLLI